MPVCGRRDPAVLTQLPKRRRRLPPNRPTQQRYSLLYNAQPSVPVQSPSVVQYAGVCTTLRAGTGLSRHGTGVVSPPTTPFLLVLATSSGNPVNVAHVLKYSYILSILPLKVVLNHLKTINEKTKGYVHIKL